MIRHFSFYHKDTGEFSSVQFSASDTPDCDANAALNCPVDHLVIDGWYDRAKQKVEGGTGTVVDKP